MMIHFKLQQNDNIPPHEVDDIDEVVGRVIQNGCRHVVDHLQYQYCHTLCYYHHHQLHSL